MRFVMGKLAMVFRGLLWSGLAVALSCAEQQGQEQAQAPVALAAKTAEVGSIAWFDGGLEEAFAAAASAQKPLFLYWGARWCPPCNQLKSTVFKQPEFIAQTRRYVAYRLDGDDPAAQRWAEHFGAMGYPTLIVFDAQGRELTRLSSGMQLERYAKVLERAPAAPDLAALIAQWKAGRLQAWSQADWEQVAFYPWGADMGRMLAAQERSAFFAQLQSSDQVPTEALRRRIHLLWASEQLQAAEEKPLGESTRTASLEMLGAILNTEPEWRASLTWLQYSAVDWIARLSSEAEQREEWLQRLATVMEEVWSNTDFGLRVRLLTLRSHLDSYALLYPDQAPSPALVRLVEQRSSEVKEQASTPYERQSLIYNAAWYLHEVGLSAKAEELLLAELETAVAPHYYMSYLARFAQDQGQTDQALRWHAKAFEQASGAATRMQWGLAYLAHLLELSPNDDTRIVHTLGRLADIAQQQPSSLYQRSRVRLERMRGPLLDWAKAAEGRGEGLASQREPWLQACSRLESGSPARQACAAFWPQV